MNNNYQKNNMNNNRQVQIIQFIHPGAEHCPSKKAIKNGNNIYGWNYGGHRRKYMKVRGSYVNQYDSLVDVDDLYFWGEWEPTSYVSPILPRGVGSDMPQFLHEPFLNCSPSAYPPYQIPGMNPNNHRQNTDPFVFNTPFLYCLCKQDSYKVLRYLAPGSIILFGSSLNPRTKNPYFALDTVFVVGEPIQQYVPNNYLIDLNGAIPQNYDRIMGFADWNDNKQKCLYKGVTFKTRDNFGGMFSFAPCKIGAAGKSGFERVKLTNANFANFTNLNIITDNLSQGLKCTNTNIKINIKVWNTICNIVQQQGCLRGVKMDYTIIP